MSYGGRAYASAPYATGFARETPNAVSMQAFTNMVLSGVKGPSGVENMFAFASETVSGAKVTQVALVNMAVNTTETISAQAIEVGAVGMVDSAALLFANPAITIIKGVVLEAANSNLTVSGSLPPGFGTVNMSANVSLIVSGDIAFIPIMNAVSGLVVSASVTELGAVAMSVTAFMTVGVPTQRLGVVAMAVTAHLTAGTSPPLLGVLFMHAIASLIARTSGPPAFADGILSDQRVWRSVLADAPGWQETLADAGAWTELLTDSSAWTGTLADVSAWTGKTSDNPAWTGTTSDSKV